MDTKTELLTEEQFEEWVERVNDAAPSIPLHCRHGVVEYILEGREVGGFLQSVIKNDLFEALARADAINLDSLHNYMIFFHNYAPKHCFGSPDAYARWIDIGGLRGQTEGNTQ